MLTIQRDKLKADIAAQTRNLREADGNIKQFIQEDLQNLAEELRETERQLSKLDEGRKNNMIAIRDLEMTKERLLSPIAFGLIGRMAFLTSFFQNGELTETLQKMLLDAAVLPLTCSEIAALIRVLPKDTHFDPILNSAAELQDPEINIALSERPRLPRLALKFLRDDWSYAVRRNRLANPQMLRNVEPIDIKRQLDQDPTLIDHAAEFEIEAVVSAAPHLVSRSFF